MQCHPFRTLKLRLTLLILSALTLASCATSLGSLSVNLGAVKECRRLTPRLQPPDISPKSDYRDIAPQSLGQLNKGNQAITRRNRCEDKVVNSYKQAH